MISSFSDFPGKRSNYHYHRNKEEGDDSKNDEGHVIKKIELHFVSYTFRGIGFYFVIRNSIDNRLDVLRSLDASVRENLC